MWDTVMAPPIITQVTQYIKSTDKNNHVCHGMQELWSSKDIYRVYQKNVPSLVSPIEEVNFFGTPCRNYRVERWSCALVLFIFRPKFLYSVLSKIQE